MAEQVRLKKYFYVLRLLLAVRWIDAGKGVPPMRFDQLLAGTVADPLLLAEIHELLAAKRRAGEAEYGPHRERIHAFISTGADGGCPVGSLARQHSPQRQIAG